MKPKTHEENRSKVCVLCLQKVNLRPISEKALQIIKDRYIPDIETKNWYYPTRICSYCSFAAYSIDSERSSERVVKLFPYKFNIKIDTRSGQVCEIF